MSMRFTNNYPSTLWAMVEWYHPGCEDGGDWEKAGWWKIDPGQTKTVFGDDVSDVNRYWYFFAHAADGAAWAGPFREIVPHIAFDWCEDTANTDSRTVGMRELDVHSADDFTLRFVA